MQGGVGANKLNKMFNIPDMNQIKMKNTDLMDDIKIKTNNSLNENKIIKTKNQSVDYLIKYFEGMIKNYINLYESRGKNMDELKEIIFDNNYTNKLKGGVTQQDINNNTHNGYINESTLNPNQHIPLHMPLDNNNNRKTVYIKFYRTPPPNPNPLNQPGLTHTIRILHAGNCFLCDQYNIINIIRFLRDSLNNNDVNFNIINRMNDYLMDDNLMNDIHHDNIDNNIQVDPIIFDNPTPGQINMIDNTINLYTDLGNIIDFSYVLEEMSQQFNNYIQQIDDPQNNPENNQHIPLDNNNRINYHNFLRQTIQEINNLLNPQNHILIQNQQFIRFINNNLQSFEQINIFDPSFIRSYYLRINNIIRDNNSINNNFQALNTRIHAVGGPGNIQEKYRNIGNLNIRANNRQRNNQLDILIPTNFQSFIDNDKIIINNYRKINNILQEIINFDSSDRQIIKQIKYQINLLNNQINLREYHIKIYKNLRTEVINQGITQLNQQLVQLNQQLSQMFITTQMQQQIQGQIFTLQQYIQYLTHINNINVFQQYENYIYNHINPQIIQCKELIIQLNQLLNQCYLGFIKRTVRNFNQQFGNLGINPIISSHINVNNIYDLEIDLQHNYIADHCNKIFNDNIEDTTHQNYITELLEKVIKRLIDLDYNEYTNGIWLDAYSSNNNIQPVPIIYIENTRITLYKSITSLLIMILTIRRNMDKNIYKTYNSSYLLAATCKYMFLKNMSPDDYADVFGGGNVNLLTYIEHTIGGVIGFYGDCVLNVLTCVRNRDLRELFVHKIKYSENQFINPLHNPQQHNPQNQNLLQLQYNIQIPNLYTNHNNIINFNLVQDHYIDLINNELNDNNMLPVFNECNFKGFIQNFVNEYHNFVNYIITNSQEIHQYAVNIRNSNTFNNNNLNNNYNLMNFIRANSNFQNVQFNNIDFENIYEWYKKFYSVLRNNLLDYRLGDDDLNFILFLRNDLFNSLVNLPNNRVDFNNNNNRNKLILLMDTILNTSGNSYIIFYINVLISLRLIRYKIDYLFDDDIMDILKHSNKRITFKCFRNLGNNRNELELIFPQCHEPIINNNNNERYLFINTCLDDEAHAVLTIIKINRNNNKKIYLYDINDLTLYTSENFNANNIVQPIYDQYIAAYPYIRYRLINTASIWGRHDNFPHRHWIGEKLLKFRNLENLMLSNNGQVLMNIIPQNNLLQQNNLFNIFNNNINGTIYNIYNRIFNINCRIFNMRTLLNFNFNVYTENNFNRQVYTIIKRIILNDLINHCNNYINVVPNNNQLNNQNFNDITNLRNDLVIIADDQNCSIRKLLFIFVKCLLKAKVHNNNNNNILNNEYRNVANYFNDIYRLNTQDFINYLNFNHFNFDINGDIQNILNIICYDIVAYNFNGGNYTFGKNMSIKCNYSIIKKVLIALLIILIIIIVVLIVLYIINKYKNNNNLK